MASVTFSRTRGADFLPGLDALASSTRVGEHPANMISDPAPIVPVNICLRRSMAIPCIVPVFKIVQNSH